MVASNFAPALRAVLVHEGGFSNHPADPGGATMQGIIQSVYNDFRRVQGLAVQPVKMLTPAERDEIYKKRYWDLIKGDQLPAGVDYVVFDGCVNSGAAQSTKWLQRAVGVPADGVIGPQTLAAVAAYPDYDRLIADILARRLAMLQNLKTWKTFGKGWGRRVAECKALGQAVASGSVELPVPAGWAGGKGYVSDAKAPPPKALGDALAAGGVVQTVLTTATDALAPAADRSATVATVITVLLVVGAAAAVCGLAYRTWAKAKADRLADALDLAPPVLAAPEPPAREVLA